MKIEILIGMIGSGKSTYARRRAAEGALVVCHDDLTAMLHARYRYEPGLRDCYRRMEEWLVLTALDYGRDVVVDRTHLARESRARWVEFARWFRPPRWRDVRIEAVLFPIEAPEVHARRRYLHDPRGRSLDEWLAVARYHHEQAFANPLSGEEGFDDLRPARRGEG